MGETTSRILDFTCKYFNLTKEHVMGHSIKRDVSIARHIMWYVLHVEYKIPTSELARAFNRTRRNIFIGIDKIKSGCKRQKYYKEIVRKFKEEYDNAQP